MEKLAFIELLDKILLSDDVVNAFHKTYKENNFHSYKENAISSTGMHTRSYYRSQSDFQ